MKIFLGTLISLIILAGATLTILALWGITPINWEHIWKTGVSIGIASITFLILWLMKVLFFQKDPFKTRQKD